jgi:hypothetical protein
VWTDTVTDDVAAVHVHAQTIIDDVAVIDGLVDAATPALVADAVWDEALTAGTHNVANSAGRRLRRTFDATELANGTAQAGAIDSITLAAGASAIDNFYDHTMIVIASGTGIGQARLIHSYNGTTKVATVHPDWDTAPNGTSDYSIMAMVPMVVHDVDPGAVTQIQNGLALEATCQDILTDTGATLDAKIDSILADTDELQTDLTDGGRLDLLVDAILLDTGTTLDGKITVVDGKANTISTAVVTTIPAAVAVVDGIVDTILVDTNELQTMLTPDGTLDVLLDSILEDTAALSAADPAAIADAVWDEVMGHTTAGTAGKALADAQSAGDPWSTAIPGAYAAGTAGKKMSDMAAEVTAILVDTSTTLDGKLDVIDTNVDAILVDTGTTLDTKINTIDGIVDNILVDTGTTLDTKINTIGTVVDGIAAASVPPTPAAIADAVWDEVISTGHAVGNSAAVKLMAAAAGLATSQAGLGAVACVVTVTVSAAALQDCDVWVTSDSAGTTVVAGTLQTNASGQVTFYLDAGTYYVWQQKDGYNFTNPDTLVVT